MILLQCAEELLKLTKELMEEGKESNIQSFELTQESLKIEFFKPQSQTKSKGVMFENANKQTEMKDTVNTEENKYQVYDPDTIKEPLQAENEIEDPIFSAEKKLGLDERDAKILYGSS